MSDAADEIRFRKGSIHARPGHIMRFLVGQHRGYDLAAVVGHLLLHESGYLLAKGQPKRPYQPPPVVIQFKYTGNALHSTQ